MHRLQGGAGQGHHRPGKSPLLLVHKNRQPVGGEDAADGGLVIGQVPAHQGQLPIPPALLPHQLRHLGGGVPHLLKAVLGSKEVQALPLPFQLLRFLPAGQLFHRQQGRNRGAAVFQKAHRGRHRHEVLPGIGDEPLGGALLVGKNVNPFPCRQSVGGKGETDLLPLLQHGADHLPLGRAEKAKAINEDRRAFKIPVFLRQLGRLGDVVQGVAVAAVNHRLVGPVDTGDIPQLLCQLGVQKLLGDGGKLLRIGAALLQLLHRLEHGLEEGGAAPLALVHLEGILHLLHRQLHQHQLGGIGEALFRQTSPGPEDIFRQAGEAEDRDGKGLLPGEGGVHRPLRLEGKLLRNQQDGPAALPGAVHCPKKNLGGLAGAGETQNQTKHPPFPPCF